MMSGQLPVVSIPGKLSCRAYPQVIAEGWQLIVIVLHFSHVFPPPLGHYPRDGEDDHESHFKIRITPIFAACLWALTFVRPSISFRWSW